MSSDVAGAPDDRSPAAGRFEDGPRHLVAVADLAVEVTDHSGRHTSGRLVGTGHRLRLEVADPAVVMAATGRGTTHGMGAQLAAAGVRLELHGPRGRVAMIDPERMSRLGRLLTGSSHVTVDRAGWTVPARAVLPAGATLVGRVTAVAAAVAVLGVLGLGLTRSRRRR